MKKMIKKFFGLDKYEGNNRSIYGGYSFGYCTSVKCGWDILESAISDLTIGLPTMTLILFALKIAGIFSGSWFIVFLPILIRTLVWNGGQLINRHLNEKRGRLRDEYYREMERQDIERMKAMDEEEDEDEDEDEGPVDLSL